MIRAAAIAVVVCQLAMQPCAACAQSCANAAPCREPAAFESDCCPIPQPAEDDGGGCGGCCPVAPEAPKPVPESRPCCVVCVDCTLLTPLAPPSPRPALSSGDWLPIDRIELEIEPAETLLPVEGYDTPGWGRHVKRHLAICVLLN
ncbi:MAG: hypothetical protein L6Q92_14190 [Phycisphaerae bacterium]|nr:hypothetical protein [Phycisphaerae bacterium]